ncbi:MAG: hypothetical protein ACYDCK_10170, partial [Thermoplasmatota archaeon]
MTLAEEARRAATALTDAGYARIAYRAGSPDALAAAAVLAVACRRAGLGVHATALPAFDEPSLAALRLAPSETLVTIGLPFARGEDARGLANALVEIHHDENAADPPNAIAVTAARIGVDPNFEASCGALALGVAHALASRNGDLATLALAGATTAGQGPPFRGINAEFLAEALEGGLAERVPRALPYDGAPLIDALTQSVAPFLPGISGRARVAKRVLDDAAVDSARVASQLTEAEDRRVASALALKLIEHAAPDAALDALSGPRHRAVRGPLAGLTVPALAERHMAAASFGRGALALAAALGDASALPALAEAEVAFRAEALAALLKLERERASGPFAIADAPRALAVEPLARLAALAHAAPAVADAADGA